MTKARILLIGIFLLCIFSLSSVQANHAPLKEQKVVVLIHGLMRTSASMMFLSSYLKKQGYEVQYYNYPSAKNTIHEHGLYLNEYVKNILAEHPKATFYFVTHSLGGIIARDALAQLSPEQLKRIGGLIMLAPPNQGSALAKLSMKAFPMLSYFVKPLAELSSEQNAMVHTIAIPKTKIGIIAGRYDAKVPPASARLEGQAEPILVNSTHTFIMNNAQAKILILRFIEEGSFDKKKS